LKQATLQLAPPADYDLARDVCSYGYFLLAPNHWDHESRVLWRVFALADGPVLAEIAQPKGAGGKLRVRTSRSLLREGKDELVGQVTRMLRLDESAEMLAEFHRLDPRFKKSGRGRLFRSPTLFEDVIKTVTSCNVQWPGTITMNQRLCEVVGAKVRLSGVTAHAFPSAKQLAKVSAGTLRGRCRVGYRDKRIVELARLFSTHVKRGGIDQAMLQDPATPDDVLFRTLVDLPGIGPYAAANIMQLLGRYGRLPLDTESVRHGRTMLGLRGSSAQVMKKVHAHFAPMGDQAFRSYWFEMWTFYESKHGPAWTWERSTTGRLFTAAQLNK
jgi:3-methyladenine DNA glycosylase/8-oxoguanine DNA glycosylase